VAFTVLCVDDNPDELVLRKAMLEQHGYSVVTASAGFEAFELAVTQRVDLVVLDYRMGGMDGEAIAKVLKANKPRVPVIILSGFSVPEHVLARVDGFAQKGDSSEDFLNQIEKLLHRRKRAAG